MCVCVCVNKKVTFPGFLTREALESCREEARSGQDTAFTTDNVHTAYLLPRDEEHYLSNSVRNHSMRTKVASIAFDELPPHGTLANLYQHPTLLHMIASVVHNDDDKKKKKKKLYLSSDPLGCCSINVFRPSYHHSFHFDESEFSTTLMIQQAQKGGLFQYTHPLRNNSEDLAAPAVASVLHRHDAQNNKPQEPLDEYDPNNQTPELHTLDFAEGTLSIFSGSKSLHRVTPVEGPHSRLVAVLTFASQPGFCNSGRVQSLFWGRSVPTPLQW